MLKDKQLVFIGGGAIAEALLKGVLKAELVSPRQITVCDIISTRLEYLNNTYGINTSSDSAAIVGKADIVFLTIKPQVIFQVVEKLVAQIKPETLIVSVAAGINLQSLQDNLPGLPIVRVMPNTPVAVSEGMSAIALGAYAEIEHGELVSVIFSSVGRAVMVDEHVMDAITGLSGSGPAYSFVIIDALADAGVRVGLPRQTAILLAAQTLLGSAKMVLETAEHPAKLRDMVTSPGGTTIAGIHVLEQRGLRGALIDAVIAAAERSREMGKKA